MGCTGCSVGNSVKPNGCKSNGSCSTGGCNRLNTYDWLSHLDLSDPDAYDYVEVSFKNGARKNFYRNHPTQKAVTGEAVVVEAANGYDVGHVTLSGELVRLQMKKKKITEDKVLHAIIRHANERDLEKLHEARILEQTTMVKARAIARTLDLEMKIGDVEYQGDKRKATFYYTADVRVDFRELIRHYAKEFRVKIEMRQIGARQESARIGGIGSCGRELCCSTWLTDFKSVSTTAARYQNLAINQAKLSGQCGRLKCCLNYELDTYLEALEAFPENAEVLLTQEGKATLVKTDIFKKLMYYSYEGASGRGKIYVLNLDKVKSIKEMNENDEKPLNFASMNIQVDISDSNDSEMDYEDVTGFIELPPSRKSGKKRRKGRGNRNKHKGKGGQNNKSQPNSDNNKKETKPQANKDEKNNPKRKSSSKRRKYRNKKKKDQPDK